MDVSWARCGYARAAREGMLSGVLGPMMDCYLRRRDGRARGVRRPAAAGHLRRQPLEPPGHADDPARHPAHWRNRTAVAAAADYFYKKRWKANGVALLFNTVPLGRNGGGLGSGATDHVDRLIDQRWNLLMFPEGTRSRDGRSARSAPARP